MKRSKIIMLMFAFVLPALLLAATLYADTCIDCVNDTDICSDEDPCDPNEEVDVGYEGTGADYWYCGLSLPGASYCEDWEGPIDCIVLYEYYDNCTRKERYDETNNHQCGTD